MNPKVIIDAIERNQMVMEEQIARLNEHSPVLQNLNASHELFGISGLFELVVASHLQGAMSALSVISEAEARIRKITPRSCGGGEGKSSHADVIDVEYIEVKYDEPT